MQYTQQELEDILDRHKKWLDGEKGGEFADLSNTDFSGANLSGANLTDADLTGANLAWANLTRANLAWATLSGATLRDADLTGANLAWANLSGANLSGATLSGATLRDADLTSADFTSATLRVANLAWANLTGVNLAWANLSGATLSGANLTRANLTNVISNEYTAFYAMQCPEEGSFIGFKKARGKIVKLLIPEDAKRSSATSRKCRCDKAVVLSITEKDGTDTGLEEIESSYDRSFIYRVGETVKVDNYDNNRWKECAFGIHFFITRQEAVNY